MAKTGFIEVDEGQLFWKYDAPMDYKDSAQRDLRTRPVLLFIHVITLSDSNRRLSYPFLILQKRPKLKPIGVRRRSLPRSIFRLK